MRLLDARTYEFREFDPGSIPPYAILSHTWGKDEVTFTDLDAGEISLRHLGKRYKQKAGWQKIAYTCKEAIKDGLDWVWCDCCCIDKRSSAELSEAINSMFAWYESATVCYVYLADVARAHSWHDLQSSRWFSRGWTLQEMLAPQVVEFFSKDWVYIGKNDRTEVDSVTKVNDSTDDDMTEMLTLITGIEHDVLSGKKPLKSVSIARRMSWVSRRQTTRPEDIAYCLLGIFGINMPTIYGEGSKAFLRLQEEILKISDDHSIFAWTLPEASPSEPYGMLASSPKCFRHSANVTAFRDWTGLSPYSISNQGLSIQLPLHETPLGEYHALLNCTWSGTGRQKILLCLRKISGATNQFQRVRTAEQKVADVGLQTTMAQIYVRQDQIIPDAYDILGERLCHVNLPELGLHGKSKCLLSSIFHTGVAMPKGDWYKSLMEQRVNIAGSGLKTSFYMPGEPATLTAVMCFEIIPEYGGGQDSLSTIARLTAGSIGQVPPQSLMDVRDRRTRACVTASRDPTIGSKFLVLVGTAHRSHEPVFLPALQPTLVEEIENSLATTRYHTARVESQISSGEIDEDQGASIIDVYKFDIRRHFDTLAAEFKKRAMYHHENPQHQEFAVGNGVDVVPQQVNSGMYTEAEFTLDFVAYEVNEMPGQQSLGIDASQASPFHLRANSQTSQDNQAGDAMVFELAGTEIPEIKRQPPAALVYVPSDGTTFDDRSSGPFGLQRAPPLNVDLQKASPHP